MAENESIKITQLPSATVTEDGDYLVFSTETNTFKIKVKDFMVQFTQAINKSIADEETSRKTADNLLQKNIDDEVTKRESADTKITNALNEESNARIEADTILQNNIDNETFQRLFNVSSLRKDVDTFKGVSVINGDGQTKVFTVEHNLSTKDLLVQAYLPIGEEELEFNVVRNLNSLELTFNTAPQGEVRIVYTAVNSWSSERLPFNLPFEQ